MQRWTPHSENGSVLRAPLHHREPSLSASHSQTDHQNDSGTLLPHSQSDGCAIMALTNYSHVKWHIIVIPNSTSPPRVAWNESNSKDTKTNLSQYRYKQLQMQRNSSMSHSENHDKILVKFPPDFFRIHAISPPPPNQFKVSNMTANGKCSLLGNHGAPLNKYTVLPSLRYNYKAMSFHLYMYLF